MWVLQKDRNMNTDYGLMIDIACCGSDCFGNLNNPIASSFRVLDGNLEVLRSKDCLIVPNETITNSAKLEFGLDLESIKASEDSISLEDYVKFAWNTLSACNERGFYLLGFNQVGYDLKILNAHFSKYLGKEIVWREDRIINACDVCRLVLPYREVGSFTMDSVMFWIDGTKNSVHLPKNDVDLTIRMIRHCMEKTGCTEGRFSELYRKVFVEKPFEEFTFGKYKGLRFEEVLAKDRGYIMWLSKNVEGNIPLQRKIKEELEKEVQF